MIRWNEQQRALRDGFDRWRDALSASHIELDRQGTFPHAKWELIRKSGILRLPFDEAWGGWGRTFLPQCTYSSGLATAVVTAA